MSTHLSLRLSDKERRRWKACAALLDKSLSDIIRDATNALADEVIRAAAGPTAAKAEATNKPSVADDPRCDFCGGQGSLVSYTEHDGADVRSVVSCVKCYYGDVDPYVDWEKLVPYGATKVGQ